LSSIFINDVNKDNMQGQGPGQGLDLQGRGLRFGP